MCLILDQIRNGGQRISPEPEITIRQRWPTGWWTQYIMLSWRSFKQTKGVLKQGYSIAQNLIVSLVVGIIYWQLEMNLNTTRDLMGLVSQINLSRDMTNQQSNCAPSEDSDQPGHPPSLIRVFAVRMKKAWVLSYPLSTQRRL